MKKYLLLFAAAVLIVPFGRAQEDRGDLPKGLAPGEEANFAAYNAGRSSRGITSPPNFSVRTMAEWEEIQTLTITWTSYPDVLTEIVRYAVDEVQIIILCTDPTGLEAQLQSQSINTSNIVFMQVDFDSIWIRDYAANTIYENDVDSLYMVDWIYNRPRPDDDVSPTAITNYKGITLYETTAAPNDLVNTGGNFMVDGWGTAFASKLILEENEPGNPYGVTVKSEAQIDSIMSWYMGIDRYIKMETLPYDAIHHIDMHMKLLDEETLLVGEYPQGVADGPQIEANMQYVLSNHNSIWGTPYKLIRVEMPPENGNYPDATPWWNAGAYRTYTNCVFINKTVLVPTYETQFDTTALRIIRESLPGYKVHGIECNDIIQASGAIHCITHSIGVNDPMWISHQRLPNTSDDQNPYTVDAFIKHRSGIANATMYWTTDTTAGYTAVAMSATGNDWYTADIPAQQVGTQIFYYVHGEAVSGKQQVRPIVAPDGYWDFWVTGPVSVSELEVSETQLLDVFPNPASAITCIPVESGSAVNGTIKLFDVLGNEVKVIHTGAIPAGTSRYFIFANEYEAGAYFVVMDTENGREVKELLIK